ncbi:MAG: protoglobin family protein [Gemmataceae bacterium]
MNRIDEPRLEHDLDYRFGYLAEFIGFGPEDHAAIQASAMYLGPMVPQLVEATYQKLLGYDATARHFLPRQYGYEGELPAGLADLATSPQLQFRKEHLGRYFYQLLGRSFDAKMVRYLDMVGKIHTPKAGNAEIDVPLVQMNALMGLLGDVLTDVVSQLPLDPATMVKTIRAFHKVLWIQNDFITRHYVTAHPGLSVNGDARLARQA